MFVVDMREASGLGAVHIPNAGDEHRTQDARPVHQDGHRSAEAAGPAQGDGAAGDDGSPDERRGNLDRFDALWRAAAEEPFEEPSPAAELNVERNLSGGTQALTIDESFAFGPASLVVSPGTRIAVLNQDRAPHTVTAVNKSFDSGTIPAGQRGEFTAPRSPGTYPYICTIHPSMTGTLIVK